MGEPLQQRDHMEDLHVCSAAILNWILMKQDRSGRGSSGLEQRPVAGALNTVMHLQVPYIAVSFFIR